MRSPGTLWFVEEKIVQPTTPSQKVRLGIHQRLVMAFGLLSLLVALVTLIALWGLVQVGAAARQAIAVDGQMSRLASQVAIKALLCRRYEKDFFLNIGDQRRQDEALEQWRQADDELDAAIEAFGAAAALPEDQQEVRVWKASKTFYANGFVQVAQNVVAGRITTPRSAGMAFEVFRENMTTLTDRAVAMAQRKDETARQTALQLETIGANTIWQASLSGVFALGCAVAWSLFVPAWMMRPIAALHETAKRLAGGDLAARVNIVRNDEFGVLAQSFNTMAAISQQRTEELEVQYRTAEAERLAAEHARAQIAEQLTTIESQRAVIQEMSVPILPLNATTLVMPLVGALDTSRLGLIQERALQAIEASAARCLILDITGVPIVDTQVAQGLMQVVQAAQLLGARVVLVGIRPEVAQAIVGLGINLNSIVTRSSLQSGIAYAITGDYRLVP